MIPANPADENLYRIRAEQAFARLRDRYVLDTAPLTAELAVVDGRPGFVDRPATGYRPAAEGEPWGSDWRTGWFRLRGLVPAAWAGREVAAWIEIGGEGLLYRPDGSAIQGISNGSVFSTTAARPHVRLFERCAGGEEVDLWLEGAANQLFGICPPNPEAGRRDPGRFGAYTARIERLRLAAVDPQLRALHWDMEVLLDLHRALPQGSVRRARILLALTRCCASLARMPEDVAAARATLAPALAVPSGPSEIPVRAVGHAHIDTAWLWPVAESERKVARTFANQLALIDRYPGYVFGASSAQHYAWVKQRHPEMFARIRAAVAAGRWELQGGMWVEADCNIPSGESLVRQFVHGMRFFRDEFGVEVDNLWLPDVFGYSAALPQIMRRCGIGTFLTQKISWSQVNRFPCHTFWWQGLDGSRVLAHFPPEDTYNSELLPSGLVAGQARFTEKAVADVVMSLFGVGDGGGGPREDHVERGLRLASLDGCPPVRFGSAADFFARLHGCQEHVRTWSGELYLERHRGTFTTQAEAKRCNRLMERRLRELELLHAALPAAAYPRAELDALWKETLTLQFHDILPGSSIHCVYDDARAAYGRMLAACDGLQECAGAALLRPAAGAVTLFNPLAEAFRGAVALPPAFAGRGVATADGAAVPVQDEDGVTVALVSIPALGWTTLHPVAAAAPPRPEPAEPLVMDNGLVRFVFAADGRLLSAVDLADGREALAAPGNLLSLYHDHPCDNDAWDIDVYYREERVADAVLAVEDLGRGPVRRRLRLRGRVGDAEIEQIVSLEAGSRRLDFRTRIDWRERHRMLRVAFPAAARSEQASCEIQFGHIPRPTGGNTSWDQARFEVPAHRFVDISDGDGGLALLNDGKYGHSVQGGVLDLNLLRSPSTPDPDADQGVHLFTYAVLPHAGGLVEGGVRREAALLNQPPVAFAGLAGGAPMPLSLAGDGVDLVALKRAEGDDSLVARLVETRGRRSRAVLALARPGAVQECDLLERPLGPPAAAAASHEVLLQPFEIRTLRLPG